MKALGAVAVEAARSEVVSSPGTGNQARLRHSHASRSRHRSVGLLYLGRILRIVNAPKLHQVVVVARRRFRAVNGISLFVDGHQGLRTRATGRATDASKFGNHLRHMPGQHPARVGGWPVKVQGRVRRTPNIRRGCVTQGTDTLIADAGEAVEGRQRRRFDAELANA